VIEISAAALPREVAWLIVAQNRLGSHNLDGFCCAAARILVESHWGFLG
jgi:hypothetical protein